MIMSKFKIEGISKISDIMKSIFRICAEKRIDFTVSYNDGSNEARFDKKLKKVSINIGDLGDENLLLTLEKMEKEVRKES